MHKAFALLTGLLLAGPALAEDSATPPLPAPPAVDWQVLPESARVRPDNADGKPHQAIAHLLIDRDQVQAGETFRIGVHVDPDDHWHTYWKSPGGVGIPTNIAWDLPEGSTVTEHEYPVPQRFDSSDIVSFGYEDQVLLISELTLPEGTPDGELTISATVDWLVCENTCIPSGDVELSLPIQVANQSGPGPFAAFFDHYQSLQPTEPLQVQAFAWEPALDSTAAKLWEMHTLAFLLTPTGDHKLAKPKDGRPAFAPIASSSTWYVEGDEVHELPDGRLLAVMKGQPINEALPTDDRIGGLFQVQVGDAVVAAEFTATFPLVGDDAEVAASNSPVIGLIPGEGDGGSEATVDGGEEGQPSEGATAVVVSDGNPNDYPLPVLMAMAFLGGLILNVMPCVLPVLTLKLFGLVSHADATPAEQRKAGFAYTAGILVSFWALAAGVIAMKAVAGSVGWGFQFQSPLYVAGLGTVVFAFGLSMFGVFEVPALGADAAAGAAASKTGLAADFMNGVFATLLATPCSAPILAPAVTFALAQPAAMNILFFTLIGLGLASPFLVVAFVPALFDRMPAPGEWMDTVKQFMGFTLVATTIWMVKVLSQQVGVDAAIGYVSFLAVVALACWIFGTWGGLAETRARQASSFAVALLVVGLGGWGFLDFPEEPPLQCDDGAVATELEFADEIPWQAFTEDRVAALADKAVFVDFTATWCFTCKVNERAILETDEVRTAMRDNDIVPLKADWTNRDPYITEWLARFGKAGVPFYLVLPPNGGEPIALPEVITQSMVIDALEKGQSCDESAPC